MLCLTVDSVGDNDAETSAARTSYMRLVIMLNRQVLFLVSRALP